MLEVVILLGTVSVIGDDPVESLYISGNLFPISDFRYEKGSELGSL